MHHAVTMCSVLHKVIDLSIQGRLVPESRYNAENYLCNLRIFYIKCHLTSYVMHACCNNEKK